MISPFWKTGRIPTQTFQNTPGCHSCMQSPPRPPSILEYLQWLAGFQLFCHFQAGVLCYRVIQTGIWYTCFWPVSHKGLKLATITELLPVNQPSRIYPERYPTQRWWMSIYKWKLALEEWLALSHWMPSQQPHQ